MKEKIKENEYQIIFAKKGIIKNINLQYSSKAENRATLPDDLLFKKGMFENAKNGMQHTIPISTNFKAFKFFSISMGGNYQEVWALKTKRYFDYNEVDGVIMEEIKGFDRFAMYNYSASMTTNIYGTLNFKPDKKIQSIRHVITPSISYSNSPSFEKYYDTYIIDAEGNTAEYTRFQGGLYGAPSKNFGSSIGIGIQNSFEAKVKPKDSTITELKKIKLLNNLNITITTEMEKTMPAQNSISIIPSSNRLIKPVTVRIKIPNEMLVAILNVLSISLTSSILPINKYYPFSFHLSI